MVWRWKEGKKLAANRHSVEKMQDNKVTAANAQQSCSDTETFIL